MFQNHKRTGRGCSVLLLPLQSNGLLCIRRPLPNALETCSGGWRTTFYPLMFCLITCSRNMELCPFCGVIENIFHIFIECPRLASLFMILSHVLRGLGLVFTRCVFIFGFSISYRRKNECLLANYLSSEAKLAIYLSRKHKMQNVGNSVDDVVHIFKYQWRSQHYP